MPQHKSAEKRVITNEKRRLRNVSVRSEVKTSIKKLRATTDNAAQAAALPATHSILDRAAKKGVLKRNTASRRKSRLAKMVNRAAAKA